MQLAKWSFDEPLDMLNTSLNKNQALAVDSLIWAESWSGFALNRRGTSVQSLNLPMATATRWQIASEEGAIRFWVAPAWSSQNTGLGSGPGHLARLLELTLNAGNERLVFWSLHTSADGNALYLSTQGDDGPVDCLQVENLQWRAGEWHLVTMRYGSATALTVAQPWLRQAASEPADTPRETQLYIDEGLAARGPGLPAVPAMLAASAFLSVGSDFEGRAPAEAQLEELVTFDWPLSPTQVAGYYEAYRRTATLGPVTPQEEAAFRAAALARRVNAAQTRATDTETSLLPTSMLEGGGGMRLLLLDPGPTTNFWLTIRLAQQTNIALTIGGADTNISYDIYYVPALTNTNVSWESIAFLGGQGQTNFITNALANIRFYRAYQSEDWDRDGITNWRDANPKSTNFGALTITIESPAHGANLQ